MDDLDKPISSEIKMSFVSFPSSCELVVPLVPLWTAGKGSMRYFDECCGGQRDSVLASEADLDTCFFSLNIDLISDLGIEEKRVLPKGFYANEFLELNPFDIQGFLHFQREYGMVYGARQRKPFGTRAKDMLRPEPNRALFVGNNKEVYAQQYQGILSSQALFDSVPNEDAVDKYSEIVKLSAVSFREAIFAVLDAQRAIKDVIAVHTCDSGQITKRQALYAQMSTQYISRHLNEIFPPIELVTRTVDKRGCDLITAVLAQTTRSLLSNESFRTCANPECGRVFTPGEMGRRSDTRYCTRECQERAKRLRYLARH